MTHEYQFPKLRAVDVRPITQGGWPAFMLRDPLRLCESAVLVPRYLGPVLLLCDGTHDRPALRAALTDQYGLSIDAEQLEQLLGALDSALLLDNERFAEAQTRALEAYRRAPFRPPAQAGPVYPADEPDLRRMLRGYLDAVDSRGARLADGSGIVSPHIDYARGGPVYAAVWKRAEEMVRAADVVVLLGTDHAGEVGQITLTRQHYATPLGVLPTARGVVDALALALGDDAAFAGELRHRHEHSIELAAVWLQAMRGIRPCEVVPILCGPLSHCMGDRADPAEDPALNQLLDTLARATAGQRVLAVAAGDLAHVGPAFGGSPLDAQGYNRLRQADDELIEQMCAGDAAGFFGAIKRVSDRNNVCGVTPIYLALRLISPARGELVSYDQCPADERGTSAVSVCGVVLGPAQAGAA